ncbi:MAG: lanthionine synthetase C family protein [Algicola sp.]|nr:lanthionine synthetase C family protein [Algicola sp.]
MPAQHNITWYPVANEAQHPQIIRQVEAIAKHLAQKPALEQGIALAGGTPGISLFLTNYQKLIENPQDYTDAVNAGWQMVYQVIEDNQVSPSLYSGLSGIAWTIDYLQHNSGEPFEDYNEELDQHFDQLLSTQVWQGEYELITGLCGIGLYGLGRCDIDSGHKIAEKVIHHIIALAHTDSNGTYWATDANSAYGHVDENTEEVNLGLAHGTTGVIALLSKAVKKHVLLTQTAPLLKSACEWLLAQKNDDPAQGYFSYNNLKQCQSRLGWCYGDLSNAYVLYKSGLVLQNKALADAALSIALATCKRKKDQSGMVDASFCHGSAGIMFMYQRLFFYCGDEYFKEAAQYWLAQTLELADSAEDLSGFNYYRGRDKTVEENLGFLEGYSGIGLALLASIQTKEPDWDEVLMLG